MIVPVVFTLLVSHCRPLPRTGTLIWAKLPVVRPLRTSKLSPAVGEKPFRSSTSSVPLSVASPEMSNWS